MSESLYIFFVLIYIISIVVIVLFSFENKSKDDNFRFAGFWLRLAAGVIDNIFIAIISLIPALILGYLIGTSMANKADAAEIDAIITGISYPLVIIIGWLYFSILESSKYNATFGKKILGIIVVDTEGNSISFARSSGRFFGKFLSTATLLIGYFIIGSTKKKQALHDILAGCLVVYRDSPRYLSHATPRVAETPSAPVTATLLVPVSTTPPLPANDAATDIGTNSLNTSDERIFEAELLRRYRAGEISDDVFLQLIRKR